MTGKIAVVDYKNLKQIFEGSQNDFDFSEKRTIASSEKRLGMEGEG